MSQRYFDPQGLARVGHMELVARQVVEGFLTGRHRSPYHGFSVEYLDHRAYTPGDDLRSLDWKILARTDKYRVKLFQDETNLRAHILLDCSASMAFQSGDLSKLDYGSYLAAALSYLMLRQNDAVGLVLFDRRSASRCRPGPADAVPPRPRFARNTRRSAATPTWAASCTSGRTHPPARPGDPHQRPDRRRGEDRQRFAALPPPASRSGRLPRAGRRRADFPYDRITRFKDMEGAGTVVTNPKNVRSRYLARMQTLRRNDPRRLFLPQDQLQLGQHQQTVRRAAGGLPGKAVRTGLNGWT